MFRLPKVKPPHGWSAAAWELAVVTIGVMLALAAQQWADERSWNDKVRKAKSAVGDELATHYNWSVEWRASFWRSRSGPEFRWAALACAAALALAQAP